ncbi:MAG: site-specific DNA-methyltransferase [Alphaproteobacteria bacterium]|nr:site-specific DNA-methyltransferase [Alphaproteobacteria bacterium]MDA8008593.1 site-specific DNA-methyltransferase [Alphaproteobacteria bacterium]
MPENNYESWHKDDLIKEIKRLKKRKKYGLVWEDKPEDVVERCRNELPVLEEVKDREILTDSGLPVNFLIEGDNYHALSVLNYTHAGKIDVIYIDPPYNTGNNGWRYNNRYVDRDDDFKHSKWISFMEKRLVLAKKLLSRTGVIVCTIDDHEGHNVRHLLDDIFGEQNRLGTIVVVHNPRGRNDDKFFATMHEYMLVYGVRSELASIKHFAFTESDMEKFNKEDEISRYHEVSFMRTGNNSNRSTRPNLYYPIHFNEETGELSLTPKQGWAEILPINAGGEEKTWRWEPKRFSQEWRTELAVRRSKGVLRIYKKRRLTSLKGSKPKTVWYEPRYDASTHGIILLNRMFGRRDIFPYPKSIHAVQDILQLASDKNSTVLDFFAGSATTAHAVMRLNKEDGGRRKFIMATNNEGGIAEEVCYPRIRKAVTGYEHGGETAEALGGNLKYFRTSFVSAETTDSNKEKLTRKATEMLCIRESTFDPVADEVNYKIFRGGSRHTGIVYDQRSIDDFKAFIRDIDSPFSVYIFSLGDDTFEEEFEDVKEKVTLSPIPETILQVYRSIFQSA